MSVKPAHTDRTENRVEIRANDKSDTWGIAGGYNLGHVVS